MSSQPPQPPPLRMRPTAALVRAAAIGCGALALAVLTGRPELILAGLPLLAWALVALARRILRGEEQGIPTPRLSVNRRRLEEGGTAAVRVAGTPGTLVAATIPRRGHTALGPRHGSLGADGTAGLRVSAQRWGQVSVGPVHVLVADALGAFRAQRELPPLTLQVVPTATV